MKRKSRRYLSMFLAVLLTISCTTWDMPRVYAAEGDEIVTEIGAETEDETTAAEDGASAEAAEEKSEEAEETAEAASGETEEVSEEAEEVSEETEEVSEEAEEASEEAEEVSEESEEVSEEAEEVSEEAEVIPEEEEVSEEASEEEYLDPEPGETYFRGTVIDQTFFDGWIGGGGIWEYDNKAIDNEEKCVHAADLDELLEKLVAEDYDKGSGSGYYGVVTEGDGYDSADAVTIPAQIDGHDVKGVLIVAYNAYEDWDEVNNQPIGKWSSGPLRVGGIHTETQVMLTGEFGRPGEDFVISGGGSVFLGKQDVHMCKADAVVKGADGTELHIGWQADQTIELYGLDGTDLHVFFDDWGEIRIGDGGLKLGQVEINESRGFFVADSSLPVVLAEDTTVPLKDQFVWNDGEEPHPLYNCPDQVDLMEKDGKYYPVREEEGRWNIVGEPLDELPSGYGRMTYYPELGFCFLNGDGEGRAFEGGEQVFSFKDGLNPGWAFHVSVDGYRVDALGRILQDAPLRGAVISHDDFEMCKNREKDIWSCLNDREDCYEGNDLETLLTELKARDDSGSGFYAVATQRWYENEKIEKVPDGVNGLILLAACYFEDEEQTKWVGNRFCTKGIEADAELLLSGEFGIEGEDFVLKGSREVSFNNDCVHRTAVFGTLKSEAGSSKELCFRDGAELYGLDGTTFERTVFCEVDHNGRDFQIGAGGLKLGKTAFGANTSFTMRGDALPEFTDSDVTFDWTDNGVWIYTGEQDEYQNDINIWYPQFEVRNFVVTDPATGDGYWEESRFYVQKEDGKYYPIREERVSEEYIRWIIDGAGSDDYPEGAIGCGHDAMLWIGFLEDEENWLGREFGSGDQTVRFADDEVGYKYYRQTKISTLGRGTEYEIDLKGRVEETRFFHGAVVGEDAINDVVYNGANMYDHVNWDEEFASADLSVLLTLLAHRAQDSGMDGNFLIWSTRGEKWEGEGEDSHLVDAWCYYSEEPLTFPAEVNGLPIHKVMLVASMWENWTHNESTGEDEVEYGSYLVDVPGVNAAAGTEVILSGDFSGAAEEFTVKGGGSVMLCSRNTMGTALPTIKGTKDGTKLTIRDDVVLRGLDATGISELRIDGATIRIEKDGWKLGAAELAGDLEIILPDRDMLPEFTSKDVDFRFVQEDRYVEEDDAGNKVECVYPWYIVREDDGNGAEIWTEYLQKDGEYYRYYEQDGKWVIGSTPEDLSGKNPEAGGHDAQIRVISLTDSDPWEEHGYANGDQVVRFQDAAVGYGLYRNVALVERKELENENHDFWYGLDIAGKLVNVDEKALLSLTRFEGADAASDFEKICFEDCEEPQGDERFNDLETLLAYIEQDIAQAHTSGYYRVAVCDDCGEGIGALPLSDIEGLHGMMFEVWNAEYGWNISESGLGKLPQPAANEELQERGRMWIEGKEYDTWAIVNTETWEESWYLQAVEGADRKYYPAQPWFRVADFGGVESVSLAAGQTLKMNRVYEKSGRTDPLVVSGEGTLWLRGMKLSRPIQAADAAVRISDDVTLGSLEAKELQFESGRLVIGEKLEADSLRLVRRSNKLDDTDYNGRDLVLCAAAEAVIGDIDLRYTPNAGANGANADSNLWIYLINDGALPTLTLKGALTSGKAYDAGNGQLYDANVTFAVLDGAALNKPEDGQDMYSEEFDTFRGTDIWESLSSVSDITDGALLTVWDEELAKNIQIICIDGAETDNDKKHKWLMCDTEDEEWKEKAGSRTKYFVFWDDGEGHIKPPHNNYFYVTGEEKDAKALTVTKIEAQVYTGSEITPAVTVKDGETPLVQDRDYTVSYRSNTNAGTAVVTIEMVLGSGYVGSRNVEFTIAPKDLSDLTVAAIADQTYTGSEITPAVKVTYGEIELTADTDYTVEYSDNINAGTAKITIQAAEDGNYTGSCEKTFAIVGKDISKLTVAAIADQTYTGSAITPVVKVSDGAKELKADTDYTVTYSANINAGTAKVTIQAKEGSNYTGSCEKTFAIVGRDISKMTADAIAAQTYTGSAITPAVTVKDGETALKAGTDYTVTYSANVNAGTAKVTVQAKEGSNYTGSLALQFTISAKDLSKLAAADIAAQTYTGSAITPAVAVSDGAAALTAGTDYTVTYANNVNVGTATVTVTGKGNYAGTLTKSFTIAAKDMSKLTIADIAAQTYTGSAITPAVTVQDGAAALKADTDYTAAYSNNTDAGTATVTVTGKGNYAGTLTKNFTIAPKDIAAATVSAVDDQFYTGSEIKPAVTVKDGAKELKADTDYTVSYKDNKEVGTAQITVTGKGNYTGSAVVKFKILQSLSKVSAASASYTSIKISWEKLSDVAGYKVYRAEKKNGAFKLVKTIDKAATTSYTDTKLTTGKTYYYKVAPYLTSGEGPASKVVSAAPVPAKVKISKLKNSAKKTVTITWKKVAGANGYEVYRATKKNGKFSKVKAGSATSCKDTKASKGKTYYYKVRAYSTVKGKKVYGAYSDVKSIKVKK